MATDVARLSFDPARLYRGVAYQQGRVTLEAEQNEQRVIDSEERRKEIIDIVGPAGTPDNGYAVTIGPSGVSIGPGTMYVGGWRVSLHEALDVANQPDWLDQFPATSAPPNTLAAEHLPNEHVLLWLQDTDVTAVEDPALYEVALGGPDGAARTRLLQRIKRIPTTAVTCADALAQDQQTWAAQGLEFHPKTMQLRSQSRLQVAWEGIPEPPNVCEPASTGGFLGAENQCIRVQLTAINEDGTFDLLWGYDDASFLYRVTPDTSNQPVLTLERAPVDDYHRPQLKQPVQLLRATANLASTDGVIEGYVAALGGEPGLVTTAYDPDTRTVQADFPGLPNGVPADYSPQLYLRVWNQWLQKQTLNTPISLEGTGVTITVAAHSDTDDATDSDAHLHLDDYWCIGVRPATPTAIYPERYLRAPQRPDGPHQWVCPLAVISPGIDTFKILADCRVQFPPLTELECCDCCTVDVRPSDAANLPKLIAGAAQGRASSDADGRISICFQPGRYELSSPLVLAGLQNVILRACNDAVVLAVAKGQEAAFAAGMVLLINVSDVTIDGFEFDMPQVFATIPRAASTTNGVLTRQSARAINTAAAGNLDVSAAILLDDCTGLTIERCVFRFSPAPVKQALLGAALFGRGPLTGIRLCRNQFLFEPSTTDGAGPQLLTGFLHLFAASELNANNGLPATLDDAVITDNEFRGLTLAIGVIAELGEIQVADNLITDCYAGVLTFDTEAWARTNFGSRQVAANLADTVRQVQDVLAVGVFDPVLLRLIVLAQLYSPPLPDGVTLSGSAPVDVAKLPKLRQQAIAAQRAYMTQFDKQVAGQPAPANAATEKAKTVRFAGTEAVTADANLVTASAALAQLASVIGFRRSVPTSLRIRNNSVDCELTDAGDTATGPALFTFLPVDGDPGQSSQAIDANRLVHRGTVIAGAVSSGNVATAIVAGGAAGTINGNIIIAEPVSENEIALQLAIEPRRWVIVGNVIVGTAPALPSQWRAVNAIG
jgi:hypothetical protein